MNALEFACPPGLERGGRAGRRSRPAEVDVRTYCAESGEPVYCPGSGEPVTSGPDGFGGYLRAACPACGALDVSVTSRQLLRKHFAQDYWEDLAPLPARPVERPKKERFEFAEQGKRQ